MNHLQFKTRQTAADYVAQGLDEPTQEAFELHLMGCPECLQDVEIWRAIKQEMPRPATGIGTATAIAPAAAAASQQRRLPALQTWRMAASWLGIGILGAAGGWLGKSLQSTDLASAQTVVFSLPAMTRDAECVPLLLASDTRSAIVRIPQVSRGMQVVALDSDQHQIGAAVRTQPDRSQLMRLDSRHLTGRDVYLQARGTDASEPLGCITGQIR
jgi:anti-sigma factor RsiW